MHRFKALTTIRKPIAFIAGFGLVLITGLAVSMFRNADQEDGGTDPDWNISEVTVPETQAGPILLAGSAEPWQPGYVQVTDSEPVATDETDEADVPRESDPGPDPTPNPGGWLLPGPRTYTWQDDAGKCVGGPHFTIDSPTNGQVFTTTKSVIFTGMVAPGSIVVAKRAGYSSTIIADTNAQGNWRFQATLYAGKNTFIFQATDLDDNCTKRSISVDYTGPVSPWDVPEARVSTYSGENYLNFVISSTLGSTYSATSQYGSVSGTVGENGLSLRVNFSGNAFFEEFPVHLTGPDGQVRTYTYARQGADLPWSAIQLTTEYTETWEGGNLFPNSTYFNVTGRAGEKVTIQSEWGRGQDYIDAYGRLSLFFVVDEGAPSRTPFKITLMYQGVPRDEFWFTHIPKEYNFSAVQRGYGCNPYNAIYSGTGTPGGTITITANFGTGEFVAETIILDGSGVFHTQVLFPGAPSNTEIVVKVNFGAQQKVFGFSCPDPA